MPNIVGLPPHVAVDLEPVVERAHVEALKHRTLDHYFGVPIWVVRAFVHATYAGVDKLEAIAHAQIGQGPNYTPWWAKHTREQLEMLERCRLNIPTARDAA